MDSTCLYCRSALGANDVIESFPVGKRLAIDAKQGRLWVEAAWREAEEIARVADAL